MKKQELLNFIKKYHLGGLVEKVIWNVETNKFTTRFILDDETVLGKVVWNNDNNISKDTIKIGISETSRFIKLLSALDDEIGFNIETKADKAYETKLSDNSCNIKYVLTNLELLNDKIPSAIDMGEADLSLKLTGDLISKFIKAKSSLEKCDYFSITADELTNECFLILSEGNTGNVSSNMGRNDVNNSINIKIEFDKISDLNSLMINANIFKDVLDSNKDFTKCTFEVYKKGLVHLTFDNEKYISEYYLVTLQ